MFSRYQNISTLPGMRGQATSSACYNIWRACTSGALSFRVHNLLEGERLDHLAGKEYGDATLWWVIAGASGIGWGMQVPPGTFIRIPTAIEEVLGVI